VLNINRRQFSENVFYIHQCLFFTDKMIFKILKNVNLFELLVLSLLITEFPLSHCSVFNLFVKVSSIDIVSLTCTMLEKLIVFELQEQFFRVTSSSVFESIDLDSS